MFGEGDEGMRGTFLIRQMFLSVGVNAIIVIPINLYILSGAQ